MERVIFLFQLIIAAVIGVVAMVALGWLYKNKEKFDPTSDKNLAYQGASSALNKVAVALGADDYEDASVGTRIMDFQEAHIYNPVTQELKIPFIGPAFNYARGLGKKMAEAVVEKNDDDISVGALDNIPPAEMGMDPLDPSQPIQVFGA